MFVKGFMTCNFDLFYISFDTKYAASFVSTLLHTSLCVLNVRMSNFHSSSMHAVVS